MKNWLVTLSAFAILPAVVQASYEDYRSPVTQQMEAGLDKSAVIKRLNSSLSSPMLSLDKSGRLLVLSSSPADVQDVRLNLYEQIVLNQTLVTATASNLEVTEFFGRRFKRFQYSALQPDWLLNPDAFLVFPEISTRSGVRTVGIRVTNMQRGGRAMIPVEIEGVSDLIEKMPDREAVSTYLRNRVKEVADQNPTAAKWKNSIPSYDFTSESKFSSLFECERQQVNEAVRKSLLVFKQKYNENPIAIFDFGASDQIRHQSFEIGERHESRATLYIVMTNRSGSRLMRTTYEYDLTTPKLEERNAGCTLVRPAKLTVLVR